MVTYGFILPRLQFRRFEWVRTFPRVLAITHIGTRLVCVLALASLSLTGRRLFWDIIISS